MSEIISIKLDTDRLKKEFEREAGDAFELINEDKLNDEQKKLFKQLFEGEQELLNEIARVVASKLTEQVELLLLEE